MSACAKQHISHKFAGVANLIETDYTQNLTLMVTGYRNRLYKTSVFIVKLQLNHALFYSRSQFYAEEYEGRSTGRGRALGQPRKALAKACTAGAMKPGGGGLFTIPMHDFAALQRGDAGQEEPVECYQ